MIWQAFCRLAFASLVVASCANDPSGRSVLAVPLDARAAAGMKIAPVELNPKEIDLGVIGLGSYLVNGASGCVDCHSCPTYAAGQSNVGGTTWYGQVKATQEMAKNAFDAINNQVALVAP